MTRAFEIDFVRQVIYQTLLKEHIDNPTEYIGGENQLSLISFYEHLETNEEVDRFCELVRDLNNQQNRAGLIANGTILSPSNPSITNLNQCTIIPLDFTVDFRCTLANRDLVKNSLDNMVAILKGRKQDIAQLDTGKLFMVGTLGNNINGEPLIRNGDFIGTIPLTPVTTVNEYISGKITTLVSSKGFLSNVNDLGSYLYFEDTDGKLKVAVYVYNETLDANVWTTQVETTDYPNVIFPPEHSSYTRWKLSISFDSSRCSEPRTLNAEDYCNISFGGSATLVSEYVVLGNELTKLGIKRKGFVATGGLDTTLADTNYTWLEPLEIPSGDSPSTTVSQLISNKFITNSHTDGLTITKQYTFIVDKSIDLLKQLFLYGRYAKQDYITPNMLFNVVEIFSSWGVVDNIETINKINESVDIENTESDTLTLTLPLQIQGENN